MLGPKIVQQAVGQNPVDSRMPLHDLEQIEELCIIVFVSLDLLFGSQKCYQWACELIFRNVDSLGSAGCISYIVSTKCTVYYWFRISTLKQLYGRVVHARSMLEKS